MPDKILLVCNDASEVVTAGPYHAYSIIEGFCLVDVTPYKAAEPRADAAIDAAEICKLVGYNDVGGMRMPVNKFRPANAEEVKAWQAKQKKAAKAESSESVAKAE